MGSQHFYTVTCAENKHMQQEKFPREEAGGLGGIVSHDFHQGDLSFVSHLLSTVKAQPGSLFVVVGTKC